MTTSFNILGDCVSRDMLQTGVLAGDFEVRQYVSFINPISHFPSRVSMWTLTLSNPWNGGQRLLNGIFFSTCKKAL